MPGGDVETAYENGMWCTRLVGQAGSARFFQTKDRAVEAGRDLARGRRVEHTI